MGQQGKGIVETNNNTWKLNHINVLDKYVELYNALGKPPTVGELATATTLSRQAVSRHLQKMELPEVSVVYKKEVADVLGALTKKAKTGDVNAIKLYAQLIFGFSERKIIESNINNKTLQITFAGNTDDVQKVTDVVALDDNTEYEDINDN